MQIAGLLILLLTGTVPGGGICYVALFGVSFGVLTITWAALLA